MIFQKYGKRRFCFLAGMLFVFLFSSLYSEDETLRPPYPPITPHGGPRVRNGADIFFMGEFIYWTPRVDTLSYAKTGVRSSQTLSPQKGRAHFVNWAWSPGFQAGIGWNLAHGDWDTQIKYTWFYSKASNSVEGDVHPSFALTSPSLNLTDSFDRARANWDLHCHIGDFEIGRNYFVHRYLKLRPFIGIKGTWQRQDYEALYQNGIIGGNNIPLDVKADFEHTVWGLGPRIGLNSSWQFAKWIGLYGDFALSGMWLHYNTNRQDTFTRQNTGVATTGSRIKTILHLSKPVLELGVGFRIEFGLKCNRFRALIQGGWETQIWPNQTLYINLNEQFDRFDLLFHGLTGKIRLDF